MNKKGKILVYLGQLKYGTPSKQHENLKFLEWENANKNWVRALDAVTTCNEWGRLPHAMSEGGYHMQWVSKINSVFTSSTVV